MYAVLFSCDIDHDDWHVTNSLLADVRANLGSVNNLFKMSVQQH